MSAGVPFTVELLGDRRTRALLSRLSHFDTDDLLDNLGQLVEGQVKTRIGKEKESPEGDPWAPLDPVYAEKKKAVSSGGILVLDQHLQDSIQHLVGEDEVEIGSNLEYVATHQHGDKRTAFGRFEATYPARPFLGLSSQNHDDVQVAITDWLRETIGR